MVKHHPLRFIAYFAILPIFCASFLAVIYNYFVIPFFAAADIDYYNILYIFFILLLVCAGLCTILAFLSFGKRFREKLKGPLGFLFFISISIIYFFAFVVLFIDPTTVILGRKFPSPKQYSLKQKKPVVINNISVVDIDGRTVLRNTRVLLEKGRIKQIGSAEQIPLPSDAEVIDGEGKTLLPGLIDAHIHLGLSGKLEGLYRSFFVESLEKSMERNAKLTIESGVTTVREMPDYFEASFELKRAVEEGRVLGPKIIASGRAIARRGGYFGWPAFGLLCASPQDVSNSIDYNLNKGADFIVIPTPNSTLYREGERDMSERLLQAAVEDAHSREAEITAHVMWPDGADMGVGAGVDGLEHMPSIMEPIKNSLVDKILREGTYVIPTIFMYTNYNAIAQDPKIIENTEYKKQFGRSYKIVQNYAQEISGYATSEDADLRHTRKILDDSVSKYFKSNFLKMVNAGATVGIGTGAGDLLMPHGWISRELEKYVEYGMSPMEAIVAATYTNAFILNKEQEIGRVKRGLKADLLIVDGDPTVDIKDIRKVDMVFKDGVLIYKK